MPSIPLSGPWDGDALGYDAWKTRSPDDERPDEECFHEDFDIDLQGRAHCRCGHSWWASEDDERFYRSVHEGYDRYCREEERRKRWRKFWRAATLPIRWPIYRLLDRVWPSKSLSVLIDDEIPF